MKNMVVLTMMLMTYFVVYGAAAEEKCSDAQQRVADVTREIGFMPVEPNTADRQPINVLEVTAEGKRGAAENTEYIIAPVAVEIRKQPDRCAAS